LGTGASLSLTVPHLRHLPPSPPSLSRSLNSRTLDALKGGKSHLDLGSSPAGLVDRRDMWTLQRSLQHDRSMGHGSMDRGPGTMDRARPPLLNRYEQLSLSSSSSS
jgi:hypothetical protein